MYIDFSYEPGAVYRYQDGIFIVLRRTDDVVQGIELGLVTRKSVYVNIQVSTFRWFFENKKFDIIHR